MTAHIATTVKPRTHRLFFALWPDADTAGHLEALGEDLARHAAVAGRVQAARSLHMTLAFVGSVDAARRDALIDAAAGLRAQHFDMLLGQLGFWPRGGVVYAAPAPPVPSCQRRLFEALCGLCDEHGIALEHRPWQPHVTLVRNARGVRLPRLASPLHWQVDDFALVESHLSPGGARYEVLARWPLAPGEDE